MPHANGGVFGIVPALSKIVVQAFFRIKTAPRKTSELIAALRSLTRLALAEKGLISCTTYLEAEAANTVCYEERWDSSEDLEEQIRSPRYTHLLALMESATEQPLLEFRFISEIRGLEYVAAVRGEESTSTR